MSKMNIGPIFLSRQNYEIVMELEKKGHFKNFSAIIDEVLSHYITTNDQNLKFIQKITELSKENFELKKTINDYRGQIIQ